MDPGIIFSLVMFGSKEVAWRHTPKANAQEKCFVPFELHPTRLREMSTWCFRAASNQKVKYLI